MFDAYEMVLVNNKMILGNNEMTLGNNEMMRYSRQISLKEIGQAGQKKLLSSKVLVVGAGGLGSPALYYLTAAGIGTIGIADFDKVNISNLQRQITHFTEDINRDKVDSAAEKLMSLNPDIKIIKHPFRLSEENIKEVIQGYDVIIDACDNFPARFLISDTCYLMKKPLVEGAVLGFEGILMTIIPGQSPCYRCLYPNPPEEEIPTCNDIGILGMIAGIIGSLQALEAVKIILDLGEKITGRLLTFDGLSATFREIKWKRRSKCPLCAKGV